MAAPDRCGKLDNVFPLDEDDDWNMHAEQPEYTTTTEEPKVVDDKVWTRKGLLERLEELRQEFGENVQRYVRKLHHGLGHPSNVVLAKTLANANARCAWTSQRMGKRMPLELGSWRQNTG